MLMTYLQLVSNNNLHILSAAVTLKINRFFVLTKLHVFEHQSRNVMFTVNVAVTFKSIAS